MVRNPDTQNLHESAPYRDPGRVDKFFLTVRLSLFNVDNPMGESEKRQCSLFQEESIEHRLPGVHRCHARGCNTPVPPEMLMCRKDWLRVPRAIQRAVWAAYRVGQCDDKNPSEAWHEAADAAIGWVAMREGHSVRTSEANALRKFGYSKWLESVAVGG